MPKFIQKLLITLSLSNNLWQDAFSTFSTLRGPAQLHCQLGATLNMIFSVTSIRSYTFIYHSIINVVFYQVKMSMFYNAQTTNSTFVGKINKMYNKKVQHFIIANRKRQYMYIKFIVVILSCYHTSLTKLELECSQG